jgi:hypothetical protein
MTFPSGPTATVTQPTPGLLNPQQEFIRNKDNAKAWIANQLAGKLSKPEAENYAKKIVAMSFDGTRYSVMEEGRLNKMRRSLGI